MTLEPTSPVAPPASPGAGEGSECARRPGVLDAVLALLVAALAFLLASTPARNSDLWLHLASGRALARGEAPPGADPFASTTAGALWVNHAWLTDAALYGLYQLGDGLALVIAKAVLVTALAGLFFCFRRRGSRAGLVALAAAIAVVALGPWLLLQPALLSLLGVALTLYLLEWPALVDGEEAERARRRRWLLVPLFALWANLDAWFLLGPALVALYAVGEALRRFVGGARGRPAELRALALLALAGLAACLLTPYHYHALAWPVPLGLSHAEQALRRDPIGAGLVVSPFAGRLTTAPAFASPGGWAYCLLLAAGLASFGLGGRAPHPGRLVAWLALAALSLYQARAIPFFAAAAGPMLALNLQEWAGAAAPSGRVRRLRTVARGLALPAGLALLVLAWPGWLQPTPYQPRAWAVERDDSLVRLAETLKRWHADGRLRDDRFALTFSPEAAHYLAWFCPSEKGFLDSRWPLFDRVADDFVAMRRCLLRPEGPGPDPALGPLLERHHLDRIILHDPDFGRTSAAYRCLLQGGDEWELLAVEGGTALFGRRSDSDSPSRWQPLDLRGLAYHPGRDERAPWTPPRDPEPPGPWEPFYRSRDERSADRGEAALLLIYFDVMAERMGTGLERQWLAAQATGLLAVGPGREAAGTAATLAVRLALTPLFSSSAPPPTEPEGAQWVAGQFAAGFLAARDRGPPEALLVAVRAARRALATNPDDAGAFLLLGEAYLRLAGQTREQGWQALLPSFGAIRRAQAVAALEQAVLLRPNLGRAHALLVQRYYEEGQLDRALDHLRARLRIAEQKAAAHDADARTAAEQLRHDVETMEGLVRRSEEIYAANSEGKAEPSQVLDRAELAARHGLTRKALDMLLASHPVIFGQGGTQMQLELMLKAGRAYEVRQTVLGSPLYHALQVQAAAACGDYKAADEQLDLLAEPLRQVGFSQEQVLPVRPAVALRVGGAVLGRPVPGTGAAGLAGAAYQQFAWLQPLGGPAGPGLLRQEADVLVLRGLLALEAGAVEAARDHFGAALRVWGDDHQAATGAGLDFLARPIAQYEMRLLEGLSPD